MLSVPDEVLKAVKQAIILPMVLTVFERDKKVIDDKIKLNKPYLELIERAMNEVHQDLVKVRSFMRKNNIKLFEKDRTATTLIHQYIFHGYQHDASFLWESLKIDVELRLGYYMGQHVPDLETYEVFGK